MVLDYYNLRQQPFGITPDPQFLWMSRTHREALASLSYGLQEDRGFMALAAPPGMGKTTLLFHLLERLRGQARTAFLFQTQCDSREFFSYLLRDMGVVPGPDLASMHDQLNQVLLDEARAGRRFVLVVDEAQDLQPSVLETIRLLSDFETSRRKLMQIIIAGQISLIGTLVKPEMEQLRQRISMMACLRPFNRDEVGEYITHRLEVAGHHGAVLFTDGGIQLIAESSAGIPRNINNICFNALSTGYALQKKRICREVVEEVLADRKIESLFLEDGPSTASPRLEADSHAPAFEISQPQGPSRRTAPFAVAAVASVFLALAAMGHSWWTNKPAVHQLLTTKPSVLIEQDVAKAPELPTPSAPSGPGSNVGTSPMPEPNLVVVEPQQTLAEISRRYLGEYSPRTIAKLRALNPSLTDPDHIEAGHQLRIPTDRSDVINANMDADVAAADERQPPRK